MTTKGDVTVSRSIASHGPSIGDLSAATERIAWDIRQALIDSDEHA